jgi:hypothetical protein
MIERAAMMHHVSDDAEFIMDTRLFDGMRFFVTQCAIRTLHRIDDNQPHHSHTHCSSSATTAT